MSINVVRNSKIPLYRQIAEQIRTQIIEGVIAPETVLPSARLLATEIDVSMFAVHRAYVELAKMGLVESKQRVGTRVVGSVSVSVGSGPVASLPDSGPTGSFERLSRSAGIRSMASVMGDPALFQADAWVAEIETLRNASPWTFDYADSAGTPELLREIARLLTRRGLVTNESSIVVTTGCLSGFAALLDIVTSPGDTILVQEPGHLWLRELSRLKRLNLVPLGHIGDGIDLDAAAEAMRRNRPKLILLTPDFGYSTGLSMPASQREEILRLARATGVLVVEDAGASALRYQGDPAPSLASLDGQNVVHIGSFSYSLCPGVGTGFVRLPPRLRAAYVAAVEALGHQIVPLVQIGLARYLESGGQEAHLRRVLPKYEARRDALHEALTTYMPPQVTWTHVVGGLATWVTLPRTCRSSALYADAIRRGVAFAPGRLFVTAGDPEFSMRLSFALLEPQAITESVRILARLIKGERIPGPVLGPNLASLVEVR
ncbi:MAG TPA: PLP-dependent aminotransferase family protein [Fimbriimonadaceae bacterium]|nr:PLP-dependent aminotransferase family protein [Fimbriimonadaceae bacterium]